MTKKSDYMKKLAEVRKSMPYGYMHELAQGNSAKETVFKRMFNKPNVESMTEAEHKALDEFIAYAENVKQKTREKEAELAERINNL